MLLKAKNIFKSFGEVDILRGVEVAIPENKITTITGASGAGKSTLLHVLGTLDTPDRGRVILDGQDITRLSKEELAQLRNQTMGFVFQFHNLLPEFTALENVMMPGMIGQRNKAELTTKAKRLLQSLGLARRINHKPSELSGGEQQRVAVARALVNDPKIVFADEPSGNLDSENATALHKLFFELSKSCAFVIVTHNNELAKISHLNLRLKDGEIVS